MNEHKELFFKACRKILRAAGGLAIPAGFILALGFVGADDYAVSTGVYTSTGQLIVRLLGCAAMVLGGMAAQKFV